MAKSKNNVFFCQECGYESAKWMGQCPGCRAWNSFVEEPVVKTAGKSIRAGASGTAKPVTLGEIEVSETERLSCGMKELDRVLGAESFRVPLFWWAVILESENRPFSFRFVKIWQTAMFLPFMYQGRNP